MVSTPRRIGSWRIYSKGNECAWFLVNVGMNMETSNSVDSIDAKIGSLAPDFKLKATNGQTIALSDFRGKRKVVLFFIREFI
jgi:cytochrome oxidase Cu insertion factor (SCO1/SenC/PrrC family)